VADANGAVGLELQGEGDWLAVGQSVRQKIMTISKPIDEMTADDGAGNAPRCGFTKRR
jgi:hypothetical protein